VIEDVYVLDMIPFEEQNLGWSRHADKSLIEDVVFLYPKRSIAPKIKLGLKRSKWYKQKDLVDEHLDVHDQNI